MLRVPRRHPRSTCRCRPSLPFPVPFFPSLPSPAWQGAAPLLPLPPPGTRGACAWDGLREPPRAKEKIKAWRAQGGVPRALAGWVPSAFPPQQGPSDNNTAVGTSSDGSGSLPSAFTLRLPPPGLGEPPGLRVGQVCLGAVRTHPSVANIWKKTTTSSPSPLADRQGMRESCGATLRLGVPPQNTVLLSIYLLKHQQLQPLHKAADAPGTHQLHAVRNLTACSVTS